jgi:precorrin-6Y C5,15-methyltransferase (decarboxylating)
MIATEGSVIAVEYKSSDRNTMGENVEKFGLSNVTIAESLEDGALNKLPPPDVAFIVASPLIGNEIKSLLVKNPAMHFLIYTLDFEILTHLPAIFEENNLERTEALHIQVSRVNTKNMVEPFPAPWLISGKLKEGQI